MKIIYRLAVLVVVLGVIVAGFLGWQRYQVEQANKNIQLLVNYNELAENVYREGKGKVTPDRLWGFLRDQQVSGIIFREQTLADLQNLGQAKVWKGSELLPALAGGQGPAWVDNVKEGEINPYNTYLEIFDRDIFARVVDNLVLKTGTGEVLVEPKAGGAGIYATPLTMGYLNYVGIGFPGEAVAEMAARGFDIWLQVRYWLVQGEGDITGYLADLQELPGVTGVFFNDTRLPGGTGDINELATGLQQFPGPLVIVEFFEQRGLSSLAKTEQIGKNVVRLHAISQSELAGMTVDRAVQRFQLAVGERNARLLLVRLFPGAPGVDWLELNEGYLAQLVTGLEAGGFTIGDVAAFTGLPFSRPVFFLLSLAPLAGLVLLAGRFKLFWPGVGAAGLLAAGFLVLLATGNIELLRKVAALGTAVVFPALALTVFMPARGEKSPTRLAILFFQVIGVSLVGGVLITGLLADVSYLVKLEFFSGVKAAHVLPLVLVAGYYAYRQYFPAGKSWYSLWQELWEKPLVLGSVVLGLVVLVGIVVFVSRTGNESAFVSGLELRFRSILDQVLGVRPRTKEFLIGYPMLLVLFYYGYRSKYGLLLVLFAAIGQVSLVNTYAHIHTPLAISLARTGHGLWLGIVLGTVLIWLVSMAERRISQLEAAEAGKGKVEDNHGR